MNIRLALALCLPVFLTAAGAGTSANGSSATQIISGFPSQTTAPQIVPPGQGHMGTPNVVTPVNNQPATINVQTGNASRTPPVGVEQRLNWLQGQINELVNDQQREARALGQRIDQLQNQNVQLQSQIVDLQAQITRLQSSQSSQLQTSCSGGWEPWQALEHDKYTLVHVMRCTTK